MMDQRLFPRPLLPPATEEEKLAWIRLIRSPRVGIVTFHRLMAEHGSASAALEALPGIAAASGARDYRAAGPALARAEMAAGRQAGARAVFHGDRDYPALLAEIPDAPPVLWALGDTDLLHRPLLALVGARNASSLGVRMARRLAATLAEAGFPVVSGLARGIDAAAHEAALSGGTVAVQAGGIDIVYPQENADLARRIALQGLRLSEQPPGMQPMARHFPLRNRIISGLCRAVVVVEAAPRSGSLITARTALDQGREVFAVPGHPLDERAGGCNMLIRDGALLVRGPEDVIAALESLPERHAFLSPRPEASALPAAGREGETPAASARHTATEAGLPASRHGGRRDGSRLVASSSPPAQADRAATPSDLHSLILNRLGPSPVAEDQVIRDLGLAVSEAAPALLSLELDGQLLRHPGGLLSRG